MFEEAGGGNLTQVETDLLTSGAIEAGETAEALDLMLKNLMDNLSPLAVAWTGTAGTAFQNVRTAVEEQMKILYAALTSIADDMGISSTQYAVTDEEIAGELAPLGNMDDSQITRLLDSDTTEVSQAVDSGASPSAISEAMNTQ
jgi:WXG100 family type VII secretion target